MSIQTRTTALQNELVRLYFTFERDGRLAPPAGQPLVEIIDTDGVTVLDQVPPTEEHMGVYYADWYVPANLPLGQYYDRWTFQWESTSSVEEQVMEFTVHGLDSYINFIGTGITYDVSNRALQLMSDLSNEFIYEAMHIPVYFEQAMRVQQENQQKRRKEYYYFTLDADKYYVVEDAVYFNNSQRFTVFQTLVPSQSSSSTSSESEGNTSSSTSSSSSIDSSSSTSSSSSSQSSLSSESALNTSSSTSSEVIPTTTTTTTPWSYSAILTTVGTGNPTSSGVLTKISGTGPTTITYTSVQRRESKFSTVYSLAYQNWNKDPRPIVRLNNRIVDDGWYADYNGRLYFDGLMAPEDSINVAYNIAYFSPEEILSFLDIGLKMMNATEPASETYSALTNMPYVWDAGVILYAAVTALKRLIFGLNFQEKRIIFGTPEEARQAITVFQSLYQDYLELWKTKAIEIKKRLPGMAQVVAPEYTLPGGRCMSSDTFINCKVDDVEDRINIETLFGLFENGKNIEVLSMLKEGSIGYSCVNKIWSSGSKFTYIVGTDKNKLRLSEDHLVYMPKENKYKPVSQIKSDDSILVMNDGVLVEEKISHIPIPNKIEPVFDIEVSSENFIGNGIVSHNSRWFRYLYKGGSGG